MATTPSRALLSVPDVISDAFRFVNPAPLAVKAPLTVKLPVNNPFPTTWSRWVGEVVPMPTFVFATAVLIPAMLPNTIELL
jgi:hypothetical protein